MSRQRTLRERVALAGVGLHSGKPIRMEVFPAAEDHGITFVRTDLPGACEVRAVAGNIVDTTLATNLGTTCAGVTVRIGTVEHLMAALAGLGVDNARVHLDGPEVPVLDGSAGPFVAALEEAGLVEQRRPRRFLSIRREVRVAEGDREAVLGPAGALEVTCSIDYDHPLIVPKSFTYRWSPASFARDLAPARTFGFLEEVEALRARGLALGGSLDNAIVLDRYRILNDEGLRFPDELVRHKVLDVLGDLALLGRPLLGAVRITRPGHGLNSALVRAVLADPTCYEMVEIPAGAARPTGFSLEPVPVG